MTTLEQAADNIVRYDGELQRSLDNVEEIRGGVGDVRDAIGIVDKAIARIEALRNEVASFGDDLGKMNIVLNLMSNVSALAPVAKTGRLIIKRVEDVVEEIEDGLDALVARIKQNPIKQVIDRVDDHLEELDGLLGRVEGEITEQKEAFGTVVEIAAKAATFAEEPIIAVGAIVEQPLAVVGEINDFYYNPATSEVDSVKEYVGDLRGGIPTADFNELISIDAKVGRIFGALDSIRRPLNDVFKFLKPIQPVLDAVGFIQKVVVDPVIEWILEAVGIDTILDKVADRILGLIADFSILDEFGGIYDRVREAIGEYDPLNAVRSYDHDRDGGSANATDEKPDPFGIGEWVVEKLEATLMEAAVQTADGLVRDRIGAVSADGVGIAIEIPQPLRGSDDDDVLRGAIDPDGEGGISPIPVHDLVLIGDRNDNEIIATGGVNSLYGAEGDDILRGGPGDEDMAIFTGAIGQYRFSRTSEDSPVVVEHVSPIKGISLDGRDTLIGIERVAFLGGSSGSAQVLTIDQLFGSVERVGPGQTGDRSGEGDVDGDGKIDSVFLYGVDPTGGSVQGVSLTGGGGDDLISGTTGNDSLRGGEGDDDFRPRGGQDVIIGGGGSDTLTFFDNDGNNARMVVDLEDGVFDGGGNYRATFSGIENVRVEEKDRDVEIYGDEGDNVLTASARRDLIDGRGGDDTISGRGGSDVLIGGAGSDLVFGGAGSDRMYSGSAAVAGVTDFYDGGDGDRFETDALSYASRASYEESRIDLEASGRIRVLGAEGRVERLSADGATVIAVDTFERVERVEGSELGDVLHGGTSARHLAVLEGGGGDDVIHVEATGSLGSSWVDGGGGDDYVIAGIDRERAGSSTYSYSGPDYFGGGGTDTLDLSAQDDLRWELRDHTGVGAAGSTYLHSYDVDERGSESSLRISHHHNLREFENYIGSRGDDVIDLHRRYDHHVIDAGEGDDTIEVRTANASSYEIDAGKGNDEILVRGTATVDAGEGNDFIDIDRAFNSDRVSVDGGAGNDEVQLYRGRGSGEGIDLDGGESFDKSGARVEDDDILSARVSIPGFSNTQPLHGIEVDMVEGRVWDHGRDGDIEFTIANFETVIGSDLHADRLGGSADGDRLIGAGGNDVLMGRAGGDRNWEGIDFHKVAHDDSLRLDRSWTVEAVISTEYVGGIGRVVSKPFGGSQVFSLAVWDGQAHIRFDVAGGGAHFVQGGNVADGGEHHLAGVYDEDAGTLTLYVDGALIGQKSLGGAEPRGSTDAIHVGRFSDSVEQIFRGDISAVRVWDEARSQLEVAAGFEGVADPRAETRLQLSLAIGEDGATDESANAHAVVTDDQSSGDDLIYGGEGNDSLYGGDGDDLLHPGASGTDLLVGGGGNDTASFAFGAPGADGGRAEFQSRYASVVADLDLGTASYGGSSSTVRLFGIENLIGTALADTLRGDGADNVLIGGDGADLLLGRAGDDTLVVEGGGRAEGGTGEDTILLGSGSADVFGDAGTDKLVFDSSGIFLYDGALGRYRSEFQITVPVWSDTGTDEARLIEGTSDTLTPRQVLEADPTEANSTDDRSRAVPDDARFEIVLTEETRTFAGTFESIEAFEGGLYADYVASEQADVLRGLSAVDRLSGLGGNDYLAGGGGGDELLGGAGSDTAGYDASRSAVQVDLGAGTASGGEAAGDTFDSIENLFGSAFNDRLTGDAGVNELTGHRGHDLLKGGLSGDVYRFAAGDGQDVIHDIGAAGDGADRLVLGAGITAAGTRVVSAGGGDLFLAMEGSIDRILLRDVLNEPLSRIEEVIFHDGTVWGHADLALRAVSPATPPSVFMRDQGIGLGEEQWRRLDSVLTVDESALFYELWDDDGAQDNWYADGRTVDASMGYVTADLSGIWFERDREVTDQTLWVRAYDGALWGEWESFRLQTTEGPSAPVLAVPDMTVGLDSWTRLDDVMQATDANGDRIFYYEIYDAEGIDSWWADGRVVQAGTGYVTADLGGVWFRGDASTSSQTLWVRASDGQAWGEWESFELTSMNRAPVVSVDDASISLSGYPWMRLADLMTASDADGEAITYYELYDAEGQASWYADGGIVDASSGYKTTDPAGIWLRADGAAGSQTLWVRASDGREWGEWESFTLKTNAGPASSVADLTVGYEDWTRLADVLSVSDPNGDAATLYEIYDGTGSQSWWADGARVDASAGYKTADLSGIWFQGDAAATTQTLWMRASDGQDWGAWESFSLTSANAAPVVSVADVGIALGGDPWVRLSDELSVSDSNGDAIVLYEVYDATGSDSWYADGRIVDASSGYKTADLSGIWMSADAAPGTQTLWVRASDGYEWSDWDDFQLITV